VPGRILVVDVAAASARMLSAKLAAEYYDVIVADSGPAAIRMAEENDPDVVLLDIMMSGMDGFEACRRLKSGPRTAHIPVVMVTALTDQADRVRGLEAGADDFLAKPVDDTALLARVNSMIRLKRMVDQWRMREEITARLGLLAAPDGTADDGRQGRIVIVEPSRADGEFLRGVLAGEHAHVVLCARIDDRSLDQFANADPDVIVIALAQQGPAETLRLVTQCRMKDLLRYVPIVLVGVEEDKDFFIKGLEIGANDYVVKPVEEGEFKARVRTQIRRKRYNDRLQANFVQNLSLALIDPLTRLHNRRYFATHLASVLRRAAESGKPAALLMIDIDHFKNVNDTRGHVVGDTVLAEVAGVIARHVRGFDLSARYGGEEFAVVMPDTPAGIAEVVADRLRERIAATPIAIHGGADIAITISVGIAQSRDAGEASESLIERADKALYDAKRQGRNRVVVAK
jgi:two-component system cell cycle response regulator